MIDLGNSSVSGEPVPCEYHKQSIVNQIVHGFDDSEENAPAPENDPMENDEPANFFDELEHISSPFSTWLEEIVAEVDQVVKSYDDGKYDNVMYNEAFAKDFIRLCKLLPLWSAISCEIFGISEPTSSSSNVECDFKNLKQALDEIIPCSIDTLVQEHIELINGQVLEASHHENYIEFIGGMGNDRSDLDSSNSTYERNKNRTESFDDRNSSAENCEESVEMPDANQSATKSVDSSEINKAVASNECPACQNGDTPGGAHLCIKCKKPIHALPGCSVSFGDEEGHGQKRICMACSSKLRTTNSDNNILQTAVEMNYKEEWNKTHQKSTSKYLSSAPNWHLNTNIEKKVTLGILQNGNKCTTTHKIDGQAVGLCNTCAVDCICQVS